MYNEVKQKLESFPSFRERSLRGVYLAKLALRSLSLEGKYEREEKLTWQEMIDFATKFDSYRHAWGDVTRENKHLRGSDYEMGEVLEQEHILNLGYEVGYYKDSQLKLA